MHEDHQKVSYSTNYYYKFRWKQIIVGRTPYPETFIILDSLLVNNNTFQAGSFHFSLPNSFSL